MIEKIRKSLKVILIVGFVGGCNTLIGYDNATEVILGHPSSNLFVNFSIGTGVVLIMLLAIIFIIWVVGAKL